MYRFVWYKTNERETEREKQLNFSHVNFVIWSRVAWRRIWLHQDFFLLFIRHPPSGAKVGAASSPRPHAVAAALCNGKRDIDAYTEGLSGKSNGIRGNVEVCSHRVVGDS